VLWPFRCRLPPVLAWRNESGLCSSCSVEPNRCCTARSTHMHDMPQHMDASVTEHALLHGQLLHHHRPGKGRRGDAQLLPLSPGHHRPQIYTPACGARPLQRPIPLSNYTSLVQSGRYSNAWHILAHRFAVPQMGTTARRCSRPRRCTQIGPKCCWFVVHSHITLCPLPVISRFSSNSRRPHSFVTHTLLQ
jgi:hypothetical protein